MQPAPEREREADGRWLAKVAQIPGARACRAAREKALTLMLGAIELRVEGLRRNGDPAPSAATRVEFVEVTA